MKRTFVWKLRTPYGDIIDPLYVNVVAFMTNHSTLSFELTRVRVLTLT